MVFLMENYGGFLADEIAEFFEIKRTGNRALDNDIAAISRVALTLHKMQAAQTVERTGDHRLCYTKRGRKGTHVVRRRYEVDVQQDGKLPKREILAVPAAPAPASRDAKGQAPRLPSNPQAFCLRFSSLRVTLAEGNP